MSLTARVLAALAALALLAAAPPPGTALERARICWAAVDAECAESALAEARGGLDALSPADALEVLRLSAEVALSSERPDDARAFVRSALERDPRFAPAWPPAWAAVVDEMRKLLPDRLPPELAPELPEAVPLGKALTIVVAARDPSGVAGVSVVVGPDTFVCLTADGERWQVELPRAIVKLPDLSLTFVATDRVGNAARATRVVPVSPPPAPPASPSVTSRWWFWTALGVGVVAATTAVVLAVGGGGDTASSGREGGVGVTWGIATEPAP